MLKFQILPLLPYSLVNIIIIFMITMTLLKEISCGMVRQYQSSYITISNSNPDNVAEYNFTMTFDTPIPSNGHVEITFPKNQYPTGLAPGRFTVYAPFPNKITTATINDRTLTIPLGHWPILKPLTITVQGIKNPSKQGGTGAFRVESFSGTYPLDSNYAFCLVGQAARTQILLDAKLYIQTNASAYAGELSTYVFEFVPQFDLPSNIEFKIQFPLNYILTYLLASQCKALPNDDGFVMTGNIYCYINPFFTNILFIKGTNKDVLKGTRIRFSLENVVNVPRKLTTDLFYYEIILAGTNSTVEKSISVPGLDIKAGRMEGVSMALKYPLYVPFQQSIRTFVLQFKPRNPFITSIISTNFVNILQCSITKGLLDLGDDDDTICKADSNIMYLSNFATYQRSEFANEYVEVQFSALIDAYNFYANKEIFTNPVQIYTYIDSKYLLLVDQDFETEATRIQIFDTPPLSALSTITLTPLTVSSTSTVLTIVLKSLAANYVNGFQINVEIPSEFTGLPVCNWHNGNVALFTSYTCSLSNGLLTFSLTSAQGTITSSCAPCPTLQITNIITPTLTNVFPIRAIVYGNGISALPTDQVLSYFTIPPPVFTSCTAQLQSQTVSQFTMLQVKIDVQDQDDIPIGQKASLDPYAAFSSFEIGFKLKSGSQTSIFGSNLGTSLTDKSDLGCVYNSGLVGYNGANLQCIMIMGDPSVQDTYTIVRVKNYDQIQYLSTVLVSIPLSLPSSANIQLEVMVQFVRFDLKIKNIIRQKIFDSPSHIATTDNGSGRPMVSGPSPPTATSLQLNTPTEITFSITTPTSITVGLLNGLMITLPHGYSVNLTSLQIQIDGAAALPVNNVAYFKLFNAIGIVTNANINTGSTHTILIKGLIMPPYLETGLLSYIETSLTKTKQDKTEYTMSDATAVTLTVGQVTVDNPQPGLPWANYTVSFQPTLQVTNRIRITFSASYSLLNQYTECDNLPYSGLEDQSNSLPVTCQFTATQVIIKNFKPLVQGKLYNVSIFGVTNPAAGTENHQIELLYRLSSTDYPVETKSSSLTISGTSFSPLVFDFNEIRVLPNNQNQLGIYFFKITPLFFIPRQAIIIITYPNDPGSYSSLFSDSLSLIYCKASGGINLVKSCDITGYDISMETYEHSVPNKTIILEYYGLVLYTGTPNTNVVGFDINIKYKGAIVAISNSAALPTANYTSSISSSLPFVVDFYPRNEGERGFYSFTTKFPNNVTLVEKNNSFLIRFPKEYDPLLGPYPLIITCNELKGALSHKVYHRHVYITGMLNQTIIANTDITITLFGVVTPNRVDNIETGFFGFGLIDNDGLNVLYGNYLQQGIIPQLAPSGIELISHGATTYSSRYLADYTFIFKPEIEPILDSTYGGQLYIDFPQEFIIDQYSGRCNTNQDFSFFANCHHDNEYLRFFFDTNNPQWSGQLNGKITTQIFQIFTPDIAGETGNFIIYNYDRFNKLVLGRTYSNLKIASLTFAYDGKQVVVNNDLPFDLEVGSYSDLITIVLEKAPEQMLTLTPNVLDPAIIIKPFPVRVQIQETKVQFRIAAPRDTLLTHVYITWSKTGDTYPPVYAPLRKTRLQMVKGTVMRDVKIEVMDYIPINGTSYPLLIDVPNPPYTQLLVVISFFNDYREEIYNAQITANTSLTNVSFSRDTTQLNYTINVLPNYTAPPSTLTLYYQLAGTDAESFLLNFDYQDIDIVSDNYNKPNIIYNETINVTRSQICFSISGDMKGFLYYMLANERVPVPLFEGVQTPNFTNETLMYSEPRYEVTYIRNTTSMTIEFIVSNLIPGRKYDFYFFLMSMNRVYNEVYLKLSNQTNYPQDIAWFTLKLKQSTLLKEVKDDYITKMADMIQISKYRIQERITPCYDNSLDKSSDPNIIYWNLLITPDPTNELSFNAPIQLVENLNQRRAEIQLFIPRLDSESFITKKELPLDLPHFIQFPKSYEVTTNSIGFQFSFSYCGTALIYVHPRNNSQNSTIQEEMLDQAAAVNYTFPTAFQIKRGLNQSNQPIQKEYVRQQRVNKIGDYQQVKFENLPDRTVYDFYIAAQNDFPDNTDFDFHYLMNASEVVNLTIKTHKLRIPLNVQSINFQQIQYFSLYGLLMLMILLISSI